MRTTTVVIGGGHAGLAMSRRLTERSIDHVVLERGEVANSWRTERWDSLRLLTPNWQARLPGGGYDGDDPDGYLSKDGVADLLAGYAQQIGAPVVTGTTVQRVHHPGTLGTGFEVVTDRGVWRSPTVVVASGACSVAVVPATAAAVPPSVTSLTTRGYTGPDTLDERGVLVVGGSATGVQLADEIQRSGRKVTLSVGEHVRMPRTYRGRDVFWWLDRSGVLDQRPDDVEDLDRARRVPSPQLVGTPARRTVDLNELRSAGVRVVGRLMEIRDGRALFSGSLPNVCALADLKLVRLLTTFDDWAIEAGVDGEVGAPWRPEPTRLDDERCLELDLGSGEIGTVLWAAGYRPDHSWLDLPVFDRKGRICHDGGVVTDAPGAFVLGLSFLRRRGSSFISGAARDTEELATHLGHHLDATTRLAG